MGYEIKGSEKDPKKIAENWEVAIGLQKVDNLEPSEYLISVAKLNIEGKITYDIVHDLLYEHYEKKENVDLHRQKECDMVSSRIVDYLGDHSFSLSPVTLTNIHKYLFQDIYDFAGQMRKYNITKDEPILGGKNAKSKIISCI